VTKRINKNPCIKTITEYLKEKAAKHLDPSLQTRFKFYVSPESKKNVGLIISERVLGLSMEVIPPLY